MWFSVGRLLHHRVEARLAGIGIASLVSLPRFVWHCFPGLIPDSVPPATLVALLAGPNLVGGADLQKHDAALRMTSKSKRRHPLTLRGIGAGHMARLGSHSHHMK